MNTNFQTDLNFVDKDTASCKGGELSDSHPLIYLDLSSGKTATCPYCSRKFKRR